MVVRSDDDLTALFGEVSAEMSEDPATPDTGTDDLEPVEVIDGQEFDLEGADDVTDADTDTDDNAEATDEPAEADETPWNWEAYAEQLIPIENNGTVEMVPLKELRNRGMMQSDYTRKTQEIAQKEQLARWAEDMQRGLQSDPAGIVQAIAEAYGLLEQQPDPNQMSLEDLDEDVRPWAEQAMKANQTAAQLQRQMEAIERERLHNEVRNEIEGLKARYGDSFNPKETLEMAAAKNMSLEDAYWRIQGEKTWRESQNSSQASQVASEAAKTAAAEADQSRQRKKSAASSTSKQQFRASDIPVDDFADIGELFEQIAAGSHS